MRTHDGFCFYHYNKNTLVKKACRNHFVGSSFNLNL